MGERAKRGQYQVIDKIAAYLDYLNPGVDEAKAHIDHIIDLCGVPPSGTGLQNLRECILWTQTKHDFEPKKKRPFWKQMSKNFIERYCYLVVFTTYVKHSILEDLINVLLIGWMRELNSEKSL